MARAADPLQEARDRARRAELADEIDVADVDAQLERRGGDQRLQLAVLQPLLGVEPLLLGQAAVMRGDRVLAQPLGQRAGDALGHAARVDEYQRGAMRFDQAQEPVVNLLPDLGRHHRFERRAGNFDRQIARALMPGVDDRRLSGGLAVRVGPDQKMRDLLRSDSASPTGRCAATGHRKERQAAPAKGSDARRACSARSHEFHR